MRTMLFILKTQKNFFHNVFSHYLNFAQMKPDYKQAKLLRSKEVQKELKIQACDIMHLREAGKLRFEKKGNAYLYFKEDVVELKKSDLL